LGTSFGFSFRLDFANDDVGFTNRQQVEFEAEAFAILVGLDGVDAVRRLVCFLDGHDLSFRY
jgi:hypothetical protein